MAFHSFLAAQIAIGLPVGIASGLAHFASLHWNVRLWTAGAPGRAASLQLVRLGMLAAVFVLLAKLGPWSLLCGAAGLLLARWMVLRRIEVQP